MIEGGNRLVEQENRERWKITNQNRENVNPTRRVDPWVDERILNLRVRELALSFVSKHNAKTQNGREIQSWPALPRGSSGPSGPSGRSWRDAKWEPGEEVR